MRKNKLLEKAYEVKVGQRKHKFTEDDLELAMAWAKDEIVLSQVAVALNKSSGSCYLFLALALKEVIRGELQGEGKI